MTAFAYTSLQSVSTSMLQKFGATVTLRIASGAYNPATGVVTTPVNTDTARYGAMLDYSGVDRVTGAGDMIAAGDRRMLLDGTATVPNDAQIIAAGRTYRIVRAAEIAPSGTTVLWDLHLRGVQ